MSDKWEYGGAYKRFNMAGVIDLPNGSQVQVHDLTHGTPAFMRRADTIFTDPPCSPGNLKTFYTKADKELQVAFNAFEDALFACLATISPQHLFFEVFKANKDRVHERIKALFPFTRVYDSCYYNRPANRCWIIQASKSSLPAPYPINGMDESAAVAWLARNHAYSVFGDPCMGQGVVGREAFLAGKPFVGTELNKKRLAVLVEFIRNHKP